MTLHRRRQRPAPPVTGPDRTCPVGLCVAATYRGGVTGEAEAHATSIVATAAARGAEGPLRQK